MPKISSSPRRSRRRRVPMVQTAEQLVEVPEFVQLAALFQQQMVDAPQSPQGFLLGQDYLFVCEQNVDIPVPLGRGGGGGLLGSRPDPNSAASSAHLPGAAVEVFTGVFAVFTGKKVRGWVRTRGRNLVRTLLHGRWRLMACPWCPSQCWRWSLRRSTLTNGWMNSAVGGPGRRSTLGGGSCTAPLMVWSGGTSLGGAGELLWSVCPSLHNDRCWGGFQLSSSPSSCVSLRRLLMIEKNSQISEKEWKE